MELQGEDDMNAELQYTDVQLFGNGDVNTFVNIPDLCDQPGNWLS